MSGESRVPRVLLVDDDAAVRTSLVRILSRRFDVVAAADASEAVRLMADGGVDVVVSDYQMPGKNGIWLLREIQSRYPSVRRVLISGIGAEELQQHVDSGLVHQYLQKPLVLDSFVEAVLTVLHK